MIAFVSGKLVEKHPTEAIIDVQGMGYRLLIPTSTFEALPEVGAPARLFTHLHVREDAMQLFGFATRPERAVFQVMLGVSGVGPKLALAALSALPPAEIRRHVVGGDAGFLTRIPGVGRKTAERLVIELRDRLDKMDLGDGPVSSASGGVWADAAAAMEALGFSRVAAERALREVQKKHPDASTAEEMIRHALRTAP